MAATFNQIMILEPMLSNCYRLNYQNQVKNLLIFSMFFQELSKWLILLLME